MGLWPFGKGGLQGKKLPEEQQPAQQDISLKTEGSGQAGLPSMPKPSSIFEFGKPVPLGAEFLRGMCAGDDPDAIQACAWTIEEAADKQKRPLYRIEF